VQSDAAKGFGSWHKGIRDRTQEETRFLRENGFLALRQFAEKPPWTAVGAATRGSWIAVSPRSSVIEFKVLF